MTWYMTETLRHGKADNTCRHITPVAIVHGNGTAGPSHSAEHCLRSDLWDETHDTQPGTSMILKLCICNTISPFARVIYLFVKLCVFSLLFYQLRPLAARKILTPAFYAYSSAQSRFFGHWCWHICQHMIVFAFYRIVSHCQHSRRSILEPCAGHLIVGI